jgi:hypothetical protein
MVGARTAAMLAALHKESEVAPPVEGIAPTTESTARVRPILVAPKLAY